MVDMKPSCLAVLIVLSVSLLASLAVTAPPNIQVSDSRKEAILDLISYIDDSREELYEIISKISTFGSRMTGYPGYKLTFDYMYDAFKRLGIKTLEEEYEVLVPMEEKCIIQLSLNNATKLTLRCSSMYPNLIQLCNTPEEGVVGEAVYLRDLTSINQDVSGKIVFVDFNSGSRWINLIKLGAKAVVFIEPETTNRVESIEKFLQTPLYFPRALIDAENWNIIKKILDENGRVDVRLISRMRWKWVKARNLIGVINGTEHPDDIVIVTSHFDSWSVAPSRASSSDEAANVAALIKLAEYLSRKPPKRSIWLVALSGHWQGLAGIREFVDEYFFSESVQEGKSKIWLLVNLDLSSGSKRVSVLYASHFYRFLPPVLPWEGWLKSKVTGYVQELDEVLGSSYMSLLDWGVQYQGWWARIPTPYVIDSEPAAITGLAAFTLRTSDDFRMYWGTPLSDLEHVNIDNLVEQLKIAFHIIWEFANDPDLGLDWEAIAPSRLRVGGGAHGGIIRGSGFSSLRGVVLEYNVTRGWFQPVPYALVVIRPVIGDHVITYPFSIVITKADDRGEFVVRGLMPSVISETRTSYMVTAWKLDSDDVHIAYAPDNGVYGKEVNKLVQIAASDVNCSVAVFRCGTIGILDVYSPLTLTPTEILDTRSALETIASQPVAITPYNIRTGAESFQYGVYYLGYEPIALVFVNPYEPVMIKVTYGAPARATSFVVNASTQYPEGYGYVLGDKPLLYISLINQSAKDMYLVSKARYSRASGYLLRHLSLERYLALASRHLSLAEDYAQSVDYSKACGEYALAWILVVKAYDYVQKLVSESAITTLIVGALIIAAALFLERLLFTGGGMGRLFRTLLVVAAMFTLFFTTFPGYKLIFSPFMLILAIPLAYMLITIVLLFINKALEEVKRRRTELLGEHEIERGYTSFLLHGVTISLRYMRRRRVRSTLTMITIVVTAFAMVSLASVAPHTIIRQVPIGSTDSFYEGYLVKMYTFGQSFEPLDRYTVEFVKHAFGDLSVNPRVWVYPQVQLPQMNLASDMWYKGRSVRVPAMLGLSAREMEVIFKDSLLEGRLPLPDEVSSPVCIVSKAIKEELGLSAGDRVIWCGIEFLVIGVYDENYVGLIIGDLTDLDGYPMLPYDPLTVPQISRVATEEAVQYEILPLPNIVIVPYEYALDIGGYVMSVSIPAPNLNYSDTSEILALLDLRTYTRFEGVSYASSIVTVYSLLGFEQILVLTLIASLNILITMLGAVQERRMEVHIHSVLGLSPREAALLFLLEITVHAVVGIAIGYLIGIGVNYLLLKYKVLPSVFIFNYSSSSILLTITMILVAALFAVVYPMRLASRMVTPSFERKWRLTVRPTRDAIEVRMPFILPRHEVLALFRYLREYYSSVSEEELRSFRFIEDLEIDETEPPKLHSRVALAPYEANITQAFWLIAQPIDKGKYALCLNIKKLTGLRARSAWLSSNYHFINSIRKQVLLWRGLSDEEKKKYYRQ